MKKLLFSALGGCALILGLAGSASSAGGKQALVIGINDYMGLKASALHGCVNDAKGMIDTLTQRGYTVTSILGPDATRKNILAALAKTHGSDVVVYFAGYGTGPEQPRLLCADTKPGALVGDCITTKEINTALEQSGARQKVAILDVSFTGARAAKSGPSPFTSRYYRPGGSRDIQLPPASVSDIPGFDTKKVAVVSAARFNEEAVESDFEGQSQGVFSRCLLKKLKANNQLTWQELQLEVSSELAAQTNDRQHPAFVGDFLPLLALNSGPASLGQHPKNDPKGGPPAMHMDASGSSGYFRGDAWNLYNLDNRDPSSLRIEMRPDVSNIKTQQDVALRVQAQRSGFLIIVNHTAEGTLNLLYPNGLTQGCRVSAGNIIELPGPDATLKPDRAGQERVKAFLFADEGSAASFLQALSSNSGQSFKNASHQLGSRGLVLKFGGVSAGQSPVVTADLSFEVAP